MSSFEIVNGKSIVSCGPLYSIEDTSKDSDGFSKISLICGERGGSGYTLFNFRLLFVKSVYYTIREGKKVLIKEVAMKEEKASLCTI